MTKARASSIGGWLLFFSTACGGDPSQTADNTPLPGSPTVTASVSTETNPTGSVPPGGGTDPASTTETSTVTTPSLAATTGGTATTVSTASTTSTGATATESTSNPTETQPAGTTDSTAVVPSSGEGTTQSGVTTDSSDTTSTVTSTPTDPGTGGTTTMPEDPPPVQRPALVTSGMGAYWQEGQLTEVAGATADLTVNEATQYQEWLGFGGSFNEAGWDALSVVSAADRTRAIQLLFDKQQGAGFNWGRVPIGASDYAITRYSLNDVADDFAMTNFSIAHDEPLLIPYIKAALGVNPAIHLWASPWSPPAWMKTNGKLDGTSKKVDGSTVDTQPDAQMKSDPAVLDAFALYLARFVEEYAKIGISIESVMPQNEPGYATRYPSCLWSASLMRDFVRDHMAPTFSDRGVPAEIWFGTMSNADTGKDGDLLNAIVADSAAMASIKGFGLQWNMITYVDGLRAKGLPILQTEHKCGNYPFTVPNTPAFNPDRPPNDHAYGEESWLLIRDWIKAGVNSYSAWNMVLDTVGKNLDFDRPWPQNALLTVDRAAGQLNITPTYYVFRHLSYFVDPGAMRIATNGTADALAFKNPDGSIVTVVYNSGAQAKTTTLGVGDARLRFDVPAHGWATVNWQ